MLGANFLENKPINIINFNQLGNCAVIKPSEHSVNAASLMAELVPKYLDNVSTSKTLSLS